MIEAWYYGYYAQWHYDPERADNLRRLIDAQAREHERWSAKWDAVIELFECGAISAALAAKLAPPPLKGDRHG